MPAVSEVLGVGQMLTKAFHAMGIDSAEDLAKTDPTVLTQLPGIGLLRAQLLISRARDLASEQVEDPAPFTGPSTGPDPQRADRPTAAARAAAALRGDMPPAASESAPAEPAPETAEKPAKKGKKAKKAKADSGKSAGKSGGTKAKKAKKGKKSGKKRKGNKAG
ncbi:MAG: helix-hairpin-helix domain-containing protein [Marinibacterium sp.]|nr:helix-hairpin-helix domain-containing protein [Marinibacterium sp.]